MCAVGGGIQAGKKQVDQCIRLVCTEFDMGNMEYKAIQLALYNSDYLREPFQYNRTERARACKKAFGEICSESTMHKACKTSCANLLQHTRREKPSICDNTAMHIHAHQSCGWAAAQHPWTSQFVYWFSLLPCAVHSSLGLRKHISAIE